MLWPLHKIWHSLWQQCERASFSLKSWPVDRWVCKDAQTIVGCRTLVLVISEVIAFFIAPKSSLYWNPKKPSEFICNALANVASSFCRTRGQRRLMFQFNLPRLCAHLLCIGSVDAKSDTVAPTIFVLCKCNPRKTRLPAFAHYCFCLTLGMNDNSPITLEMNDNSPITVKKRTKRASMPLPER